MSNLPDGCTPDDIDREMEGGEEIALIDEDLHCPHCDAVQTLSDEAEQFCSTCQTNWD